MADTSSPAGANRKDDWQSNRSFGDTGEFSLIARLTAGIATRADVLLGVGDDAAVLAVGPDALLVATCDAQVEGRHFVRGLMTPREIGHKALAVNLSDIAAMGAEPAWALISLLLPPNVDATELDGVYAGLLALAQRYSVALVGGNISATSGPLAIDITLLGRVNGSRVLKRAGARPGDVLLVTGTLGLAAAGLLVSGMMGDSTVASSPVLPALAHRARQAVVAPQPRLAEGQALAASGVVTAMLDVSDGLAGDLGHLCATSGVGAIVEASALPLDPATVAIAQAYGRDPLALALHGGEDYELLFTVSAADVARARAAIEQSGGQATVIGAITPTKSDLTLRFPDGQVRPLEPVGWDHLRQQSDPLPGSA